MMSVMIFIYTYVGLSALLVSIDRQCESPDTWNERQNWLQFFYSEMYASPGLPVNPCVRYASQKPGDKPLEEYVGAEPLVSVFSFGLIRASS